MKQIGLNKHKHLIDYRSTSHPIKPLTFLTNPFFFFFGLNKTYLKSLAKNTEITPEGKIYLPFSFTSQPLYGSNPCTS